MREIGRSADAWKAALAHHGGSSVPASAKQRRTLAAARRCAMIFRSPHPDIAIPDLPLTTVVLQRAEPFRDRPALIDGTSGQVLTYGQLAEDIRRMARGLARRGFRKGEVLAIYAPNLLEYAVAFHAAASLGGIVAPINPLCTVDELAHRLRDSNAALLLAAPDSLDRARAALSASNVRELLVFGESDEDASFASLVEGDAGPAPDVTIEAEKDLVALLYSSGTGGLPKGVMLTHRNLVAGLQQLIAAEPIAADEVVLGVLPFFHMYGLMVMHAALIQGITLVTMPRFELTSCLRALQDYQVTRAYLAPPIVLSLAKHPRVDEYDLSRLQVIQSGGAPLSEAVARCCASRLGCQIRQGYALTECYPAIRMAAADPDMRNVTSVGRCVPNTECKIVDPATGAALGPCQPGELLLRGPQVMRGYLNQPDATVQTIDADGWLHTGDIGVADEDGFFTIVDRLKELIKYKGYQVAPAELEAVLLAHPAVADAAVIPSPDDEAGEVPKAFVVLKGEATVADLMIFVAERVAPYKKIRRLEVIEQIPKSPSGKILRRVLVECERAAVPVRV
jgi:acyl-CoA synthetase (AMP-forming)/AMP-acid ligase II